MSDREVWVSAGAASVVHFLRAQHDAQRENPFEDD
jgi:hypothetical protein